MSKERGPCKDTGDDSKFTIAVISSANGRSCFGRIGPDARQILFSTLNRKISLKEVLSYRNIPQLLLNHFACSFDRQSEKNNDSFSLYKTYPGQFKISIMLFIFINLNCRSHIIYHYIIFILKSIILFRMEKHLTKQRI